MILDDVKIALRVTHDQLDGEIQDLITAARYDLMLADVLETKVNDDGDALIKRAIILFCKAQFGYDNPEAERFQRAYDNLKMRLAVTSDYIEVET